MVTISIRNSYVVHAAARPQLVAHHHALRLGLGQLALVHRRLHLHLQVRLHLRTDIHVNQERLSNTQRKVVYGSWILSNFAVNDDDE